jgi:Ras GTPase-activating-like protein IQGAP2/3
MAIHEEISSASNIRDIVHNHPMYINVAMHYLRPKQVLYIRETLQGVISDVVTSDDLDLETDPSVVRIAIILLLSSSPIH